MRHMIVVWRRGGLSIINDTRNCDTVATRTVVIPIGKSELLCSVRINLLFICSEFCGATEPVSYICDLPEQSLLIYSQQRSNSAYEMYTSSIARYGRCQVPKVGVAWAQYPAAANPFSPACGVLPGADSSSQGVRGRPWIPTQS